METLQQKIKAAQSMVTTSIWVAEIKEGLAGIPARVEIIQTGGGCTALAVLGVNKTPYDIIITQNDCDAPDVLAIESSIQVSIYKEYNNGDSIGQTLQEVTYRQFINEQDALDYIFQLVTLVKEAF